MDTIAHYTITYMGTSWLKSQIHTIQQYRSLVFAWARETDDDITQQDAYFQVFPWRGQSALLRRAGLGVLLGWERSLQGVSKRLAHWIEQEDVKLLHAHFGRAGYYALPVIRRTKIPLITSFYGYDLSEYPTRYPVWREYYRRLFAEGSYFLTEGSFMRQTLIELGCPPEKALLQRLGVDLSKIPFQARSWQPDTALNVLQVANIREKKGIPDSIRAFADLYREFPQARFTLIGDIHSKLAQPIMQTVHEIIRAHQLHDVVRLLDKVPYETYLEILREAHIFIHPSVKASSGDTEGGAPVSVIESSASGMMIVSTTHCDIPEVILHDKTGLLAPEYSPGQLTEHLLTLARSPERWEDMANAGRAHIEQNYDLHKQITSLEDTYTRVIAEST